MRTEARFICDEQLGKLAKWLRLEGFDALYECPIDDKKLIFLAQSEQRILLTRDRHLSAKTLWNNIVLIDKTNYADQLRELKQKVKLTKPKPFTRCLDCNLLTVTAAKASVEGRVPKQVYETYQEFYTCLGCRKVFWQGSHVVASRARLRLLER